MGYAQKLTKEVLNTPTGGTVIYKRDPERSRSFFGSSLSNYKRTWREKYGVTVAINVEGDVAKIQVLQGLDQSPSAVKELLSKKGGRALFPSGYVKPKAVPTPEPAPVAPAPEPQKPKPAEVPAPIQDEEARQFWKDVFLTSVAAAPGADPQTHMRNAREAVAEYVARWGGGNG